MIQSQHLDRLKGLMPGFLVSATVAMAATFLSYHYGAPVMLFALLLGMAFNFLAKDRQCSAGVAFTSSAVLRVGVALLGAKITANAVIGTHFMASNRPFDQARLYPGLKPRRANARNVDVLADHALCG